RAGDGPRADHGSGGQPRAPGVAARPHALSPHERDEPRPRSRLARGGARARGRRPSRDGRAGARAVNDFEARLRRIGAERYHHLHPFNARMHEGTLTPGEIRTWVANRYYYQTRIPIKDGLILAKAQDPAF